MSGQTFFHPSSDWQRRFLALERQVKELSRVAPGLPVVTANANSNLALNTTPTDIPGCAGLSIPKTGRWLLIADFEVGVSVAAAQSAQVTFATSGASSTDLKAAFVFCNQVVFAQTATALGLATWSALGGTFGIQGSLTNAGPTASALSANTKVIAIRLGPC